MNPVILITGATRGIGFAAAKQLAARGTQVIIASRDGTRASEAAAWAGSGAVGVALDITDQASVQATVKQIEQQFGRLDVLANNSAILLDHYQSLLDLIETCITD